HRSGRVLDEEVAIREVPRKQRVAVLPVDVDVAKARRAEEAPARDRTGGEEEGRCERRRPQGELRRRIRRYGVTPCSVEGGTSVGVGGGSAGGSVTGGAVVAGGGGGATIVGVG